MNIIAKGIKFAVIAALFAAVIPFGALLIERQIAINEPPVNRDVILVLGCAARDDGTPGPLLRSRVDKGVELWKAGYAPMILVTGGAVANDQIEAHVMANHAYQSGVPPSAVIIEPNARNTEENAKFTAELLAKNGLRSALLVTSPFHTRRARRRFLEQRIELTTIAAPYPQELGINDRVRLILRELGK